jgi:hypothetical protein
MTTAQISALMLGIALIGLISSLIAFRKTFFVKKYWRYTLILIPAILIIIVKLLSIRKTPPGTTQDTSDLNNTITEIKDQLQEAHMTTAVEVTAAREKNQEKLEELKKVTQITDSQERRKRLAELMG